MNNNLHRILLEKEQLWKGCILASIAHAIIVAHFPDESNEHSWDGFNYSVQDSAGSRGTITFSKDYYVAAFRDDNSERLNKKIDINEYKSYFNGAPNALVELANKEALQYLLDEVNGNVVPLKTTAFWGNEKETFSNDTFEKIHNNGGFLIDRQLLDIEDAFNSWKEYYDMTEQQYKLLRSIYKRKIENNDKLLLMSKDEILMIGTDDEEGLKESEISFNEIGIEWEK